MSCLVVVVCLAEVNLFCFDRSVVTLLRRESATPPSPPSDFLLSATANIVFLVSYVSIYTKPVNSIFSRTLVGYSSSGYPVLVYTKPVNSVFRTLLLTTQARDILRYSLVCKTQWTRARVITFPAEFLPDKIQFLQLVIQLTC